MERGVLLGIAIFLAVISLCHSSPIENENDASVTRRRPLLEKLGMELYRDPNAHYSPYKRRCYCGHMPPMMPWGPPFPRPWGGPRGGYRPAPRRGNRSSDEEEED